MTQMSDESKKREVVTVHLDAMVDGGYREKFPAVDDWSCRDDDGLGVAMLRLTCGPSTENFVLSHVIWWTARLQTETEAATPPPWEQVPQAGVIPIGVGRSPLPAEVAPAPPES
jgi:hypothetical protein